ncbi:ankyrin repeat-containing domain protein, partial [Tricladium varicosporioides]
GVHAEMKSKKCSTPLILASRRGQIDVIELFLRNGADVNFKDANGSTKFLWRGGHCKAVRVLSEEDVYVNSKFGKGSTAFMMSTWKGHFEVVRVLLERS